METVFELTEETFFLAIAERFVLVSVFGHLSIYMRYLWDRNLSCFQITLQSEKQTTDNITNRVSVITFIYF